MAKSLLHDSGMDPGLEQARRVCVSQVVKSRARVASTFCDLLETMREMLWIDRAAQDASKYQILVFVSTA